MKVVRITTLFEDVLGVVSSTRILALLAIPLAVSWFLIGHFGLEQKTCLIQFETYLRTLNGTLECNGYNLQFKTDHNWFTYVGIQWITPQCLGTVQVTECIDTTELNPPRLVTQIK